MSDVDRKSALKGLAVTKKMVAAAQSAYVSDYEYGINDVDMRKAIKAALLAAEDNSSKEPRHD